MVTTLGKVLSKIKNNLPSVYIEVVFLANSVYIKIQSSHAEMLCIYMQGLGSHCRHLHTGVFFLYRNVLRDIRKSNSI